LADGLPARIPALTAPAAVGESTASPLLRPRLVDGQTTTLELLLMECIARGPSLRVVCHFDEREAARATRGVISDETYRIDLTDGREELFELRLFGIER
jgi:hypothetical protein